MPNGGNPKECQKAAPFYEKIRADLESFAAKFGLEYIPWYHESPVFMLELRGRGDELTRSIQVCLGPDKRLPVSSAEEIVMAVFAHAYSDKGGRRIRSFFVMQGILPRDAGRVVPALRAATTLLTATRKADLLDADEWQKKQAVLTPILCYL